MGLISLIPWMEGGGVMLPLWGRKGGGFGRGFWDGLKAGGGDARFGNKCMQNPVPPKAKCGGGGGKTAVRSRRFSTVG